MVLINHWSLQKVNSEDVALIVTGGLRAPADSVKALALGADAIGLSNSSLQAFGLRVVLSKVSLFENIYGYSDVTIP